MPVDDGDVHRGAVVAEDSIVTTIMFVRVNKSRNDFFVVRSQTHVSQSTSRRWGVVHSTKLSNALELPIFHERKNLMSSLSFPICADELWLVIQL